MRTTTTTMRARTWLLPQQTRTFREYWTEKPCAYFLPARIRTSDRNTSRRTTSNDASRRTTIAKRATAYPKSRVRPGFENRYTLLGPAEAQIGKGPKRRLGIAFVPQICSQEPMDRPNPSESGEWLRHTSNAGRIA